MKEVKNTKMIFKKIKSNYIKENNKTDSNSSTFYSSNNYSYTDYNPSLFLDYTFKGNKNKIYTNSDTINKTNLNNYKYELEQTFKLNIDILISYYKSTSSHDSQNKEILLLLKNVKSKEKQKRETNILLKQKSKQLISNNDCLICFNRKIENQRNQYNIKIENKIKEINECDRYISKLKKRFEGVEKYINKRRFNSEGKKGIKKKNKLIKFINSNNKHLIKISNYNKDIKKLKENISELKKDNKLLRSQKKLFKVDKPDINLIRVVEFYIRIIRGMALKNKILKNSINSLSKTLDYLDLNQISNFNEYKRSRQKSSYEIEFSDLDEKKCDQNKNKNCKIINRIKDLMNFNEVLK